jgi:nucleoside-diphosphate-sugar epimerase
MVDRRLARRAVRDVDVVYHLALNWNGASWKHRLPLEDLFDANVRGALNMLEAAGASKVKHFLLASSAAVYGEVEAPRLDEETVCKPEEWDGEPGASYGILKLIVEKLCLMYGRKHRLPVTAFRIDYVLKEGERPEGGGVHRDDVIKAFLLATLNRGAYGQVFNLSSGGGDVSIGKARRVLGWEPRQTRSLLTSARSRARSRRC